MAKRRIHGTLPTVQRLDGVSMFIRPVFFLATLLLAGPAGADQSQAQVVYTGLCEASAAVSLGTNAGRRFFAVASDEVNILRSYDLDVGGIGASHDIGPFTGFAKSDIEGGARIGDIIWWISSHSFTSSHKDKKDRRILLATRIDWRTEGPELAPVGMAQDLRDGIAAATGAAASDLNIEGLAAGAGGALLIGLRAPLSGGKAQILPLRNPGQVLQGAQADFGSVLAVDLGGYGIRSLELLEDGRYLVVAGPVPDGSDAFRLYLWDGSTENPEPLSTPPLDGLRPEAAFQAEDGTIMLLSDDGDACAARGLSDDQPENAGERRFRWIRIDLP